MGFIGRHLVAALRAEDVNVIAIVRKPSKYLQFFGGIEQRVVDRLEDSYQLAKALAGVDTVIHLADGAERAGPSPGGAATPEDRMKSLCNAMTDNGIGRLVYSSTIYARLCEEGSWSSYGQGKLDAEAAARSFPGIKPVFLRLPPIYGAGCGGGFATIARLVGSGMPLPFGSFTNRRDYLAIENLASLMVRVIRSDDEHWNMLCSREFEPSDGQPVSVAELVPMIAKAMGRETRNFPFPPSILRMVAHMAGKADAVEAAYAPLIALSLEALERATGWTPPARMPATLRFLDGSV